MRLESGNWVQASYKFNLFTQIPTSNLCEWSNVVARIQLTGRSIVHSPLSMKNVLKTISSSLSTLSMNIKNAVFPYEKRIYFESHRWMKHIWIFQRSCKKWVETIARGWIDNDKNQYFILWLKFNGSKFIAKQHTMRWSTNIFVREETMFFFARTSNWLWNSNKNTSTLNHYKML